MRRRRWLDRAGRETILRDKVAELEPGRFDYVLVDCPPTLGVLTVNALTAAPEVLVPVECHVMGLQGLAQLVQTVERVAQAAEPGTADRRHRPVPARPRGPTTGRRSWRSCAAGSRARRSGPTVRENVRLAECPSMGEPITAYAPASTGAEDYRVLASEVIEQEQKEVYGTVENG